MSECFVYLFIYLFFALFPQVKAPRPTENWSATHFWVRTHQLRNTDLKHIRLFTSPFHTTLITCLHFEKGGGGESRMAAASQPSQAPGSISSLVQPKPCPPPWVWAPLAISAFIYFFSFSLLLNTI